MIQVGKVLVLRQAFHPRNGKGSADFAVLPDAGLGWALSCCLSPRGAYLHHFNSWMSHIPPGQVMPPVYMWHHLRVRWLHQGVCKQSVLERCPKRGCDKRREGRVFPKDQEHDGRAKPLMLGQLGHQKQPSRGQAMCCSPASPPVLQSGWRPRFYKVHKVENWRRCFTIPGQTVLAVGGGLLCYPETHVLGTCSCRWLREGMLDGCCSACAATVNLPGIGMSGQCTECSLWLTASLLCGDSITQLALLAFTAS